LAKANSQAVLHK